MVASTSALTWLFVGVFLCGSCAPGPAPGPLDELNINLNIKENNKQHRDTDHGDRSNPQQKEIDDRTPTEGLCFEYDMQHIGNPLYKPGSDSNNYGSTGTPQGCRDLCQRKDGCAWFNWAEETDTRADQCWLKRGMGNETANERPGSVTGPRSCVTDLHCPSTRINLQARRDWKILRNIGSAQECAHKCLLRQTCNFWTWAHTAAGQFSLDCVLMADYGNTVTDNNVISGTKECMSKEPCPTDRGWIEKATGCYKWADSDNRDAITGADNCNRTGGYLAEINSQQEQNIAWQLYQSLGVKLTAIWIGGSDEAREGRWVGHNGTELTYTNWIRDEPNGGERENCIELVIDSNGKWNDAPCTHDYKAEKALCELTGYDTGY